MFDKKSIAARFEQFAESKGSKAELARLLNVSPQALTKYFKAKSVPGVEFRKRLENLGCNIEWLLYGDSNYNHQQFVIPETSTNDNLDININSSELEIKLLKAQIVQLKQSLKDKEEHVELLKNQLKHTSKMMEYFKTKTDKLESMQNLNTETVNDNTVTARLDQGSSRTLTIEKIKSTDTPALV